MGSSSSIVGGSSCGPAAAGWLHDLTGDYTLALTLAASCLATACALCVLSLCLHRVKAEEGGALGEARQMAVVEVAMEKTSDTR